jgi:hypothetical protein
MLPTTSLIAKVFGLDRLRWIFTFQEQIASFVANINIYIPWKNSKYI